MMFFKISINQYGYLAIDHIAKYVSLLHLYLIIILLNKYLSAQFIGNRKEKKKDVTFAPILTLIT